jgi:hypothetical protein
LTALPYAVPALSLTNDILLFLAAVVAVALIGGLWPALLAAVAGFLLLNWYFTPPVGHITIAESGNILALPYSSSSRSPSGGSSTPPPAKPGGPPKPAPTRRPSPPSPAASYAANDH